MYHPIAPMPRDPAAVQPDLLWDELGDWNEYIGISDF